MIALEKIVHSQSFDKDAKVKSVSMVVLFYPDISNFTFWNVKIQNVKIFLIDFLNELGNFKQKNFYTSKCKILHFEMSG